MPTDLSKYVKLKTIVSYFLDEHDKSAADFDKAWIMAFRALVVLGFGVAFEPLTIRIGDNGNKTFSLPSDYLSWSKLGLLTSEGKISVLKVNRGISTLKDTNPDRMSYLTPDINDQLPLLSSAPLFFNYYGNGVYNHLFGYGGGACRIRGSCG